MYKVEEKNIEEIIPYVNNTKKHSEKQIDYLAASIAEFGFTSPVIVDENNVVLAGHGRLLAAKRLDLQAVPCVVVTGLTEAQKKALRIADNRIAELSEWDEELLKVELEFFNESEFDFSNFFDEFVNVDKSESAKHIPELDNNEFETDYYVQVQVENEDEQLKLIEEMQSRGYKCKALIL